MNSLEMLSMINNFPIGSVPKNRAELLSKVEIISFLARFQEQFVMVENLDEREIMVKSFLEKLLRLRVGEAIPSLAQAERLLELSPGYVQDYGKIQYIKDSNPDFDRTYDLIAGNLGLTNDSPRKAR